MTGRVTPFGYRCAVFQITDFTNFNARFDQFVSGVHDVLQAFIYIAFTGLGSLILLLIFKRKQYGIYFMRHIIMIKAVLYTGKIFHVPALPEETQASKISYGAIIALGTIVYIVFQATGNNLITI